MPCFEMIENIYNMTVLIILIFLKDNAVMLHV